MSANSSFEIIENTEEAKKNYGYLYGVDECDISKEDIEALLAGKCLATDDGEYVTFITLID